MNGPQNESDGDTIKLWEHLSELVLRARHTTVPTSADEALRYYEQADPASPLSPALRLWQGDNLTYELRFEEATQVYAGLVKLYPDRTTGTADGLTFAAVALEQMAVCYERLGRFDEAAGAYQMIQQAFPKGVSEAWLHYRIGQIAEGAGKEADAIAAYRAAAASQDDPRDTDWPTPDLARRHADRLEKPGALSPNPEQLTKSLARAFEQKDINALYELASPTHFTLGVAGSEQQFVSREDVFAFLLTEVQQSKVLLDPLALQGSGGKRYLLTDGWNGQLLTGRVFFLLTQTKLGWEWGGLVLTQPGEGWIKIFPPVPPASNQSLEISIRAPWRRGDNWRAGGLDRFLLSHVPFIGGVIVLEDLLSGCGHGPGGFYYNAGSTHRDQDAFSIDFTRYLPGVPFFFDSHGKEVLAIQQGVVVLVRGFVSGGDPFTDNRVELTHAGPRDFALPVGAPPAPPLKYRSKYLHLDGPFRTLVSFGMLIRQGTRLGFTDDTGNSAFSHLHFSIHDRDVGPGGFGSVRPTPMDGQRLSDADGGRCVSSNNVPFP